MPHWHRLSFAHCGSPASPRGIFGPRQSSKDEMTTASLRIGISSCLLGDEVRFDGGHKRDASLLEALDPYCEGVRVCPEVELGLGAPREPVRLVAGPHGTRMISVQTHVDHTAAMEAYA